jgi:hypothetical protein
MEPVGLYLGRKYSCRQLEEMLLRLFHPDLSEGEVLVERDLVPGPISTTIKLYAVAYEREGMFKTLLDIFPRRWRDYEISSYIDMYVSIAELLDDDLLVDDGSDFPFTFTLVNKSGLSNVTVDMDALNEGKIII